MKFVSGRSRRGQAPKLGVNHAPAIVVGRKKAKMPNQLAKTDVHCELEGEHGRIRAATDGFIVLLAFAAGTDVRGYRGKGQQQRLQLVIMFPCFGVTGVPAGLWMLPHEHQVNHLVSWSVDPASYP
jgi:hypothetical protein